MGRLVFKGDKPKKTKKVKESAPKPVDEDTEPEGWTYTRDKSLISGPSYFVTTQGTERYCLHHDAETLKLGMVKLGDAEQTENGTLEPNGVSTVFIVTRIPGSEGCVSIKSASGHFLSYSEGSVTCKSLARGAAEQWSLDLVEETEPPKYHISHQDIKLQASNGNVTASSHGSPWSVSVQAVFVHRAVRERTPFRIVEMESMGKRKEPSGGYEAVLDDRVKAKRDKYC